MNRFLAGAAGGLIATMPMTLVMTRLFRKLPSAEQYPLPPREITDVMLNRIHSERALSDQQRTQLSLTAHYGYGALTGALYPLLMPSSRHKIALGGIFGVGVWAASYLGWLPATQLLKPATQHPWRRNLLMISAHWLWGVATVMTGECLRRARRRTRRID